MIPDWNTFGLIPPIRPGEQGHGQDRSPYQVSHILFAICHTHHLIQPILVDQIGIELNAES